MPQFTEMRRPALWDEPRTALPSAAARPATPLATARTVVLGYDGSEAARLAASRAAEAAGRGGRVLVVTSVPSRNAPEVERELTQVGEPEQLLEEATALLGNHEIEITTRLEEGDPTEALVATAGEAEADLIVVGARGGSFPARALRGSVAERLVGRALCSVLVVR